MSLTKLLLFGVGGYVLYEYVLAPTMSAAPAAAPAVPQQTLAAQLQALAGNVNSLNIDQWTYYYNKVLAQRGQPPVTDTEGENLIAAAGLSDATRSTGLTLSNYLNALSKAGLSGLGLYGAERGFGR